jgi:hypothetical protein
MNGSTKVLIVVSSVATATALLFGPAYYVRLCAKQFLAEVEMLRPGKSSIQDIRLLERRYRRFVVPHDSPCTDEHCEIGFSFDNQWLARIHMAPGTVFGARITATSGKISSISIGLDTPPAYFTNVKEVAGQADSTPYKLTGRRATSGSAQFSLNVELTAAVSEGIRRSAYNFNLSCLTKVGGCNDARQMLPDVLIPQQ